MACREEADTPHHILLRCPALMATRHRLLGTISPSAEDARSAAAMAALAAAFRSLQSRWLRLDRREGSNNNNNVDVAVGAQHSVLRRALSARRRCCRCQLSSCRTAVSSCMEASCRVEQAVHRAVVGLSDTTAGEGRGEAPVRLDTTGRK